MSGKIKSSQDEVFERNILYYMEKKCRMVLDDPSSKYDRTMKFAKNCSKSIASFFVFFEDPTKVPDFKNILGIKCDKAGESGFMITTTGIVWRNYPEKAQYITWADLNDLQNYFRFGRRPMYICLAIGVFAALLGILIYRTEDSASLAPLFKFEISVVIAIALIMYFSRIPIYFGSKERRFKGLRFLKSIRLVHLVRISIGMRAKANTR